MKKTDEIPYPLESPQIHASKGVLITPAPPKTPQPSEAWVMDESKVTFDDVPFGKEEVEGVSSLKKTWSFNVIWKSSAHGFFNDLET